MSEYNTWDSITAAQESQPWELASDQLWEVSIDLDHMGDQHWLNSEYEAANQMYYMSDQAELYSVESYQAAWDAWNGPINAEGYSAHDASMGYTSMDTSFIEPASSAGSMSMIADYTGDSSL
ncbi:MAG: hypothetical protein ABMA25_04485 [Ilumatobacteraceae bacterium]